MNYAERPFCINRTFFALTCEIAFESLNTALLRAKRAVFGGTVNANNGDGREATRAIHLTVSMMIYSVPRVLAPCIYWASTRLPPAQLHIALNDSQIILRLTNAERSGILS